MNGEERKRTRKDLQMDADRDDARGHALITDAGTPVGHTDDSLKAGPRGPTLMEDFHFCERMAGVIAQHRPFDCRPRNMLSA